MATSNKKPVKTVTIDYTDPAPGQSTQLQIINDPGGNVGEVQFNGKGGVFAGSNAFVWNSTTSNLGIRGNIQVTGNILGNIYASVSNLKLLGGLSGYVLQTDGTGNVSWVDMQDAGGYGNTEVAEFLPTYEGELTAGNANLGNAVTAGFFIGDGGLLTNVAVEYGNSNVANYLPTYTGNLKGGNANLGNAATANYFIGNGSLLTGLPASYANSNVANYLPTYTGNLGVGNVIATGTIYSTGILSNGAANINSNVVSTNYNTGALKVRGGLGVVGNVHSGGEIHSGGNTIVGGHSLFVGTGADAIGLNNATLVAFHGGNDYVQAALKNSLSTGSADWVAYGDSGTDTQGWADFGFTSTEFDDANYTITGSGDGYFFVNTYAGSYGGNLVIATGSDGTVRDIIFATGGFATADEFARFDDSTNLFHLTRTGSGIKFADGTTQTTAYTGGGGGSSIANASSSVSIPTANGDVVINPAPTSNIELTTSLIESVSSDCYIGLANEFVADTEFNDDITVVQVGWTVIVGSTTYTVTAIDPSPPANQYRITVAGATFVSGTNYTFTNPVLIESTWAFDQYGILTFPGDALIDTSDSNFEVRGANAINFEAAGVVNIYTDTANNGYQWQFGDDGNLTLPGNSSSINYANGTPYGGGSGTGYIIPYEVATFVANTQPGFGEIQFADNEGDNSAASTAQKLFINASPTNEQSMGTIFQQWTSNSYRGTLSLNNGNDSQATFNISNGRIYFEPETYRGFQAGLNQIWGDDCSINQLIITNATAPKFYNTDFLTEDDVFHATGLATGNTHVMLNVYGSSQYNPIKPNDLWNLFVSFVDNVLYDGSTLRTDTSAIRTQFYNNTNNFRGNIPTQDLFQYFEFADGPDYFGSATTTTNGSGTGATVRIRVNPNNTYTVLGTTNPGSGYIGGETLTVLGTDLGGATPANDLTILIDSVDGDGVITQISYDSGDGVYPWPTNNIDDGGDDQYDTGNYINTNLDEEISYANGLPQTASAAFGGGNYCVMYYQSFFCMVATGVSSSVTDLFYSGELGQDGDGLLNWTGLRSNQDVTVNNNALYAYFDSEYLDGDLTPTVGTTYNMTLDSAGINLDGFYAYTDPDSNDKYFGSNTEWHLESQTNLYVQSYNDMFIRTLVNQDGTGESGPNINIEASDGSDGKKENNTQASNGGTVYIIGGDAGSSDNVDSLGNTGGSVNIDAGDGTGASAGGTVYVRGGDSANGTAGDVTISTSSGEVGNGQVNIRTNDGTGDRNWAFKANGSTIFPTLTVTRGDRTGTLTGQTLLFGDIEQSVIISTPNGTNSINDSQRIVINPGAGYANTTGEGGDIYLYAGRGGDAGGSGGDIKIRGGLGPVNGHGGYLDIQGGEAAGNGPGGYVEIFGGQSANNLGGEVRIEGGQGGTTGGNANLRGGYGQTAGGNVNIWGGGSANGQSNEGLVNIQTGGNTWTFAPNGNMTLPGNTFAVNYANGTQVNIGGGGSANTGNVTFDDQIIIGTGDDNGGGGLYLAQGPNSVANLQYLRVRAGDYPTHIHLDTGNNDAYDQYFGGDGKYLKLQADGNISIGVDYSPNVWTFDSFHNLTVPGNIKSITTGFSFTSNISDVDTTTVANTVIVTFVTSSLFPGPVTGQVTISGVVGTTETNGTWYFEAIEANQIQLYYDEALNSPVDGTGWPAYVSGGLAVSAGYSNLSITGGNVDIVTNNDNTWTFDDTGNLTLPGTLILSNAIAVIGSSAETVSVTNENGDPGGEGAQTVTGTVADNPGINTIQPGWIVTGNNITTTTIVTSVAETSPNFYEITTDSTETNPFTYNSVYTFSEAVYNTWNFSDTGNLTLPTISLGTNLDEQTVIQSQRKIIPGFRYSVEIDGSTPTVVYTATDNTITSMKVTIQIQHSGQGFEFFEVYATSAGGDTYYTVSNRVQPPTIDNSTVVVDLNGSNAMEITVTINSGAANSWVTYDATEFGISID